ncbi:hypothetical protein Skr01_06860 [Sphaerisporangium krabiense]|nr:hypothetical protein Skr01_06860 [Sphaerisporangium krabiense]
MAEIVTVCHLGGGDINWTHRWWRTPFENAPAGACPVPVNHEISRLPGAPCETVGP